MSHETIKHTPDEIQEFRARQRHRRKKILKAHGLDSDPGNPVAMPGRFDTGVRDEGGEAEGVIGNPHEFDDVHASTKLLTMDVATKIQKTYPFFRWALQPSDRGQIMNVFCLDLHQEYGYTIRFVDIMNDPGRKEAIRAAGEILERCGYTHRNARGAIVYDKQVMAEMTRDNRGNVFPDVDDHLTKKRKNNIEIEKAIAEGRADVMTLENGETLVKVREFGGR